MTVIFWNTVFILCSLQCLIQFLISPNLLLSTQWMTILALLGKRLTGKQGYPFSLSRNSSSPYSYPPMWKMKVKSLSRVPLFLTPWTIAHQTPHPWNFPGKESTMGCHFLLQGIFPIQGSNPSLLHYRHSLYCLNHEASPHPCGIHYNYLSTVYQLYHTTCHFQLYLYWCSFMQETNLQEK